LLADRHRPRELGRVGFEVDNIDFVIRGHLERVTVLGDVDRIGDQCDRVDGIDGDIGWRADNRVLQRQVGDDLRAFRIGEIEDDHRIFSGRRYDRLTLVVPQQLLVVADDQERRGLDITETGHSQTCHSAE
jgi:hypothetical protein